MVQVFKKEIEAGLADSIQADISVAFILDAKQLDIDEVALSKAIANTIEYNKQLDLFYFESILVSTGWNKNDDIFTAAELWKAKESPINKKINYMHDESDIIGHMVCSRVVDDQSRMIPYDSVLEGLPSTFDICVGGVLYKIWDNETLQARMDSILKDIATGKWKVSMECIYPHFDYGIIMPDGQHKVIARTEETSFLSKYLRRYGGPGSFENYKIGRVLRDILFSGKGLVDVPANPRSVITAFTGTAANLNILPKITERKRMAVEITETQYNELKQKFEKAEAALIEAANKEKESFKTAIAQLEKDKTALAAELAASKEVVKAHEDKVSNLNTALTKANTDLTAAQTQLDTLNSEALKAKRLSLFADIDIEATKAQDLVTKFINASDEAFAELVNALPKRAPAPTPVPAPVPAPAAALAAAVVEPIINPTPSPAPDVKAETIAKAKAWLSGNFKSTAKKGE